MRVSKISLNWGGNWSTWGKKKYRGTSAENGNSVQRLGMSSVRARNNGTITAKIPSKQEIKKKARGLSEISNSSALLKPNHPSALLKLVIETLQIIAKQYCQRLGHP